MKKQINKKWFSLVCAALIASDAKSAVKYIDQITVVRATWHNKPSSRNRAETMVVSFGAPNYLEREFISRCKRNGIQLPKKAVLKPYPKSKKA